ncbi:response regulator [Ideonella sp.]|uniref:response regulator n=1 Tax=Ideonella sp. TaxID=1929293 RepID=UPI0035AFC030
MSKPCLLVIDDNAINLALIGYLLTSAGWETCPAENGAQALKLLAQRHDFAAILCDIQMPVMDGYEFARQVKAQPAWAAVPLVAVTALAMVGDRDRILAAGFDGYVSKPIEPVEFIAALKNIVPSLETPPPQAAPAPAPAPLPPPPAGQTILVLDDTPSNLQLKRDLLQPLGYRVLTAQTPAVAMALAQAERPHLIISDVGMPTGSGFDFIAEVKADPALRDIPFLFLSATHWDERARARGLALGARRYLRRPIDSQTLLYEIRRCLDDSVSAA